jgi:hypothetical protein
MAQRPNRLNLSIPKELSLKARAKAIAMGTNLSAIVREFLEKWVQEDPNNEESAREQ